MNWEVRKVKFDKTKIPKGYIVITEIGEDYVKGKNIDGKEVIIKLPKSQ